MSEDIINSSEWYKNVQYKDAKNFIRENINAASRSFVAIGYYLKYIRDKKLYEQDGYQNIWEFAQAEFGISKSSASRFMAINDRFSKNGNSPELMDQYQDFSSSKLSEMLTLTDEQLKKITVGTTVAEIREMKRPKKELVATSQLENEPKSALGYKKSVYSQDSLIATKGCGNKYECYSCARECQIRQENRYCVEAPLAHPYPCTTMNVIEKVQNDIGTKCMFINLDMAYKRLGDNEPVPCCKECKNICRYACRKAFEKNSKGVNGNPTNVDNLSETADNVDNDPTLSIKADIMQTNSEYDFEKVSTYNIVDVIAAIQKYQRKLAAYKDCKLDAPIVKWIRMEMDALQAMEKMLAKKSPDIRDLMNEPYCPECGEELIYKCDCLQCGCKIDWEPVNGLFEYEEEQLQKKATERNCFEQYKQPELPALKNNDQRREFIDNYFSWPIWIDLKETGERYYRYNLTNKIAIVVKASLRHVFQRDLTEKVDYEVEQYYILGIKTEWEPGGAVFIEDDTRTFYECRCTISQLIDFLKEYQKKDGE